MISLAIAPFILPPLAYLIGSIPSAVLVSRALRLPDPRAGGSGNPGATNVLRLGGAKAAAITLLADALKGFAPVLAARALGGDSIVLALVGAGAFLGHLYPLFLRFRGGKGVATAAGVLAATDASVAAWLVLIWIAVALLLRYSSVAALAAAAAAPALAWHLSPQPAVFALSLLLAALLFWRHRANLQRLVRGEEGKLQLHRAR